MTFPARIAGGEPILALKAAGNVTNHYSTPGDGMILNQSYLNTTGQPSSTQAFLCSGLIPLTAAMISNGFTFSVDAAAPNWLTNGARVNFYNASTASGHFISSVTTGVTVSSDLRTITVAASAIPGTATHFATNLKWAQGIPSLVYSSTNVIPTGAQTDLAAKIMVNSGTSATCLSDVGASGTSESVSSAPSLNFGEFIVCHQGFSTYIRRIWKTGKHRVQKVATSPESHDYNNTYQFYSVVEIADTVPAPSTPGAFAANFSSTGANATTYAVQSDCHPAYKINGMFDGGVHSVVSSFVTATSHGKTNANRGATTTVNSKPYIITGVYDANRLFLTAPNTGTATRWAIDSTTVTSGTASTLSDGSAGFTITAGVLSYLYPGTQVISNRAWLEGARLLSANGAYIAKLRIQEFEYNIPNAAAVLDYVVANVGSSADLNYNNSSITMQLNIKLRWIDDAWSSAVFHQVTALQDHHCDFSWPTQWQAINARTSAGETLHFILPGTLLCGAAITNNPGDHSNGSALNFTSFQNITANSKEYYHDASVWAAASYWSDNVQRPAWLAAYGVKDSGGNWLRKFVMARSRTVGWTATGIPGISSFLSGPNKAYGPTRYNEDVSAGDVRMVVAGYGWMDPAFDTHADINFAFPLNGGQYEWVWSTNETLSGYSVPIPPQLAGKNLTLVCRSASCSLTISGGTVTVSTTPDAQFTILAG